jgi:hypothetical protein
MTGYQVYLRQNFFFNGKFDAQNFGSAIISNAELTNSAAHFLLHD